MLSQVVLTGKLQKQNSYNSIVTNVCDQIQFKLGADLWRAIQPSGAGVSDVNVTGVSIDKVMWL